MATNYIAPTWRMPENGNQSKSSNYSLNFSGSSYIDCGDNDMFSFGNGTTDSPFSVSFWAKLNSVSGTQPFLSKDTGNPNREWAISIFSDSSNGVRIFLKNQGGNTQQSIDSSTALTTGVWYHITTTYDGRGGSNAADGLSIYINGSLDTPTNISKGTYTAMSNTTAPVYIGKYSSSEIAGKMTELSIFDYDLSQSQVTTLYGNSTNGPGNPMALPTPPIAYYRLGDNSNPTSGGTLPNFPNLSQGGEVAYSNYSIKFALFDDFRFNNSGIMGGKNAYSISAWFKLDVNASSCIFSCWHGGTSVNYLLRYNTTATPVGIQWYIYSNSQSSILNTGYVPTFGVWTHVVAVKDPITNGGQSRVYINGVELTPLNSTNLSSPTPNINREDQIGVVVSGLNFVNGNISNVAYWPTTALTEPQAEEIYNNGKTIDLNNLTFTAPTHWLPLDERSVYFNGATLQARDIINNVDASGTNLREENIVGDAPGSTSNGTGSNIDILDLFGDMNGSSKNAYSINMADYADGTTNPANSGRSTNTPTNTP